MRWGIFPIRRRSRLLELHMGDIEPSLDVRIACAEALRNYHTAEVMHTLVGELQDREFRRRLAVAAKPGTADRPGFPLRREGVAGLSGRKQERER